MTTLLDRIIPSRRRDRAHILERLGLEPPASLRETAAPVRHQTAFGAMEGRIQTLSDTQGLRFVLYEPLHFRPIACYVDEQHKELLRSAWGHRAVVRGWVTRDGLSGLPISIRDISNISILPDERRHSYRDARGVLPRLLPEEDDYYRNAE